MTAPPVDLRSDTVTRPSTGMRRAIAEADVGDDVLDGDPTTRRLEARTAELLGHEAALFFPSGTQANQTAMGLLAQRGGELILEAGAHLLHYEQGALAALWGVQPRVVAAPDGRLSADLVKSAIRPRSPHLPTTAAVAVENTHNSAGGTVLPLESMRDIRRTVVEHGLLLHLDGARLWNASAAAGVTLDAFGGEAHTVMVSFSKGLGCPVGSCLAGSRDLMDRARTIRRRLGGGMRQSGILAAAGLYALDHNLSRITDDHARAARLADGIAALDSVHVVPPETNIVMIDLLRDSADDAARRLAEAGLLVVPFGFARIRAVTHLDVGDREIERAVNAMKHVLG